MSDGLSPPRKRARLRTENENRRETPPAQAPADAAAPRYARMSEASRVALGVPDANRVAPEETERRNHLALSSFLLMSLPRRGRLDAETEARTVADAAAAAAASAESVSAAAGALEMLSNSGPRQTGDEPMPMAVAVAVDESTTDDEELQQLSMVKLEATGALLCGGDGSAAVELSYEDVKTFLFNSAREQRTQLLHKGMRTVKKARNADELLPRLATAEDETGLTLLMIGVRSNDRVFCGMLLDAGADVNHKNFLLEHGANDESKNMSLIPAAHFGHLPVVKMLLDTGADQNFANMKGTTPLMRAAQEGRDAVVKFLIEKGADTCAANNEGMTALMLAAQRGHASIATTLMQSGSNVNKQTRQGSTALLLAAKRGHTAAVEALMTAGADIFLKDDREKTAAETAQRRGHVDLFLKISVQNQLRLMREDLRRQRCYEMMRVSTLYVLSRAELTPAFKNPKRQKYNALLDRTMRLPKPLLQNIALYLPLSRMWNRQLKYLIYETAPHPNRVVQQGIRVLDEVLLSVSLELRPSLKRIKQECGGPLHVTGQLGLLRDSPEYRGLFTTESRLPMPLSMLVQLRRMADIQGALASYAAGTAIQFGVEVAQDVVALITDMLNWDAARKQAELLEAERSDMEFLVHNISHSDLVVELSWLRGADSVSKSNGDAQPTVPPVTDGRSNQAIASVDVGGVAVPLSVLGRPKFSLFQQTSQQILERVQELRHPQCASVRQNGSNIHAAAVLSVPEQQDPTPLLHPSLLDIGLSSRERWKARCHDTQSPIGFNLADSPIEVTRHELLRDFQLRGENETTRLVERHWDRVGITAVYFPLVAVLLPKWTQVLREFQSESSQQLVYLISGAGIPRNDAHSRSGNSTEITAQLIALFVHQYYPHMATIQVHSGSNIFRFDDNVQF
ncbi:hypothetical protein BBJ28_00013670, partial [Nothophytophthora sp. Chile5]